MAINFPNNPSDQDTFVSAGRTYRFNGPSGVWEVVTGTTVTDYNNLTNTPTIPADVSDLTDTTGLLGSGGATVYADMAALVAATGMSNGDFGLVTATNNIYVYNGSGWYKIATVQNDSPSAITGVDGVYNLATDGTATVITAVSTDPEGFPLTWSYAVTSGSLGSIAAISQTDNVFTITPSTDSANAGTFELTFSATDGVNGAVNASSEFSLSFVSWANATQEAKIQASDAQASDGFGESVSISSDGNTAIVGARWEDTPSTSAGSAYIFTRSGSTWAQQEKLTASDAQATDYFGMSVSISSDGNTAIVGAYLEDTGGITNAGSAYIFTRSGSSWTQRAKIQASDPEASALFGFSVSISDDGNTAIVGARAVDTTASNAGAAYIFTRSGTTWSQQAKIQASDAAENDEFGTSVSISSDGDTAIVGAYKEDTPVDSGAAYVFTRSGSTWSQQQKLEASDAQASAEFGFSVSISSDGNTAIVGARYDDTTATNAGSAYIFTRSGSSWSQQAKIQASDPEENDYFGYSVSISSDGDTAIVSARDEDTTATGAGSAYIFTRSGTTWSQEVKIQASDAGNTDRFGYSVSISSDGNTAIVGAKDDDSPATDAGSAYIFVKG